MCKIRKYEKTIQMNNRIVINCNGIFAVSISNRSPTAGKAEVREESQPTKG